MRMSDMIRFSRLLTFLPTKCKWNQSCRGNARSNPRIIQPSRWEAKKIAKILKAIRRGIIDPQAILHPELAYKSKTRPVYDMWGMEGI